MVTHPWPRCYILQDKIPVLAFSIKEATEWGVDNFDDTLVKSTIVDGMSVCTWFFGLGPQTEMHPPELFTTCIFSGPYHLFREQYSTWEQAETGHNRVVESLSNQTFEGDYLFPEREI